MADRETQEFLEELEKQAKEFEERAKFWESKRVTGLEIITDDSAIEITGPELAKRLRIFAAEWRKMIEDIRKP